MCVLAAVSLLSTLEHILVGFDGDQRKIFLDISENVVNEYPRAKYFFHSGRRQQNLMSLTSC